VQGDGGVGTVHLGIIPALTVHFSRIHGTAGPDGHFALMLQIRM
jgi:hypothetical protein